MPTLVIANKLYSSWSLRPWILLRQLGISFEEVLIPLDQPDTKARILALSPGGTVPILIDEGATVWESAAIMDYAHERWPEAGVWPKDRIARAVARSVSGEMHAGFRGLRAACPMNLGKVFAARDRGPDVERDVDRITAIWRDARKRFGAGGPFLFGAFSAADAMFAPVVTRFISYSIPVDPDIRHYMDAVIGTAAFQEWKDAALKETWVVAHDEPDEPVVTDLRPNRPGKT
ncbi:glutathione S-transferase family protein [Chelatococcus asaccharovorans]|uniref:glutathione S-transferase family protein n=1 Tax=Chelatococcus asaccharovorans TaxID=28210 RepID=UPI00224C6EF6|nr:glutathione S-transferase family protein [Chelatococcus asaccharovorans]CAH1665063.1 Glutathione S-transferase [Chelatococcus asaccharovorans]CAH1682141.1 Glutathione S-transferase [Chelatococcus asaccharovorans]